MCQRRLRVAREGELVQLDGSPHDWLAGRVERLWGVLQDRWCSELRLAGVNTSCGAGVSSRKLPPFAAGLERTELAMVLLLAGGKPLVKFKQPFEKKPISGFYA